MENSAIEAILEELGVCAKVRGVTQFCAEEDGRPYQVWKVETADGPLVLKKTDADEREVYAAFLKGRGWAPAAYGFAEYGGEPYLLMEYVSGESMSAGGREKLRLTLDALISGQEKFWGNTELADVGYGYAKSYPNRYKRLAHMGELAGCYSAYLEEFSAVPRTLCNDDMLPFNVIVGAERAVIVDWEFAGILPYPCAIARLLAFGEDDPNALFRMTEEDRRFALDYYYENLVRGKGISREEYDRTMRLFFFKEYSEWIYCAACSGDRDSENYRRYAPKAEKLARELGFLRSGGAQEKGGTI